MKKIFALLLATVLCITFVSCSANTSNIVIGSWQGDYEYSGTTFISDNEKEFVSGDSITLTLNVFKGGTVQIVRYDNDSGAEIITNDTWEESDGVLVISKGDDTVGYEIDSKVTPYSLTIQGSNDYFPATLTKTE